MEGVETYEKGAKLHLTGEIETIFNNNTIKIIGNNKTIKAIMVFLIRITDPYFESEYVRINNNMYRFEKKIEYINESKITYDLNEEEIFNQIKYENFINNTIIIKAKTLEDFEYAQSLLIFEITSEYENNYHLCKELDR